VEGCLRAPPRARITSAACVTCDLIRTVAPPGKRAAAFHGLCTAYCHGAVLRTRSQPGRASCIRRLIWETSRPHSPRERVASRRGIDLREDRGIPFHFRPGGFSARGIGNHCNGFRCG
jgi:hypothetical protein